LFHFDDRLHGAFAVGGVVADDDGSSVVLQGAGDDLRGGGTEAVDEDSRSTMEYSVPLVAIRCMCPTVPGVRENMPADAPRGA
jgi:hypothetical protein